MRHEFGLRQDWSDSSGRRGVHKQKSPFGLIAGGIILFGLGATAAVALKPQPGTGVTQSLTPPAVGSQTVSVRAALTPAQADAQRQAAEAEKARVEALAQQRKAAAVLAEGNRHEAAVAQKAEGLKQVVASYMRDPSSAMYRNAFTTMDGMFLCGEVKGRNGFGGYGDWTGFVAIGHSVYFQDDPIFARTFKSQCMDAPGKEAVEP